MAIFIRGHQQGNHPANKEPDMTTLEKITAQMDAETAGMTADERFNFYRQRDIAAAAKAGLSLKDYQRRGVAA